MKKIFDYNECRCNRCGKKVPLLYIAFTIIFKWNCRWCLNPTRWIYTKSSFEYERIEFFFDIRKRSEWKQFLDKKGR